MNCRPLVSVIIPSYNREIFLNEAITSVLQDPYRPVQIIVVDDGSTDGTAAMIRKFSSEVEYIFQPNSGAASARNTGLTRAKGMYFAFLDSDDLWVNEKLMRQMNVLEEDDESHAVFGYIEEFYEPAPNSGQIPRILPGYNLGTMLIRAETFHTVGPFRTDLQLADAIEWLSRLLSMNVKTLLLSQVVYRRRIHGGNIGVEKRDQRIEYVRAIKSMLDRKRSNQTT